MSNDHGGPPSAGGPLTRGEALGREFSTAVVLFHEAVAARLGMSAAEWKCLGLLASQGPMTAGRLAELSGYTTGAITGVVDRLERAGRVRREPSQSDRRSVIIQPLRLGEAYQEVGPIFASLGAAMTEVSSRYTPEQLAAIEDYLARTTEALRGETEKLAKRGG